MKRWGLCLLRVSMGWLMVVWGLDKLVNVEHSMAVADRFYLGIGGQALFLNIFGVIQVLLGVLVVVGLWRRKTYPVLFVICLVTGLSVWNSIINPWGWVIEGANALFYPSFIIAAAALAMWGLIDDDTMALDAKKTV